MLLYGDAGCGSPAAQDKFEMLSAIELERRRWANDTTYILLASLAAADGLRSSRIVLHLNDDTFSHSTAVIVDALDQQPGEAPHKAVSLSTIAARLTITPSGLPTLVEYHSCRAMFIVETKSLLHRIEDHGMTSAADNNAPYHLAVAEMLIRSTPCAVVRALVASRLCDPPVSACT